MNIDKNNKKTGNIRILIAPLDWGLGHATRCIPLVTLLLKQQTELIVAAEGPVASLLEKEFPGIVILPLKGYRVRYSSSGKSFLFKMLLQLPAIISTIIYEKKWLDKTLSSQQIDAVISDNRFGMHTKKVPCVFITHQLLIKTGSRFLNHLAQKINYSYINQFDACWVPDAKGKNNLAGELSHPQKLPRAKLEYLGILSRCKKLELQKETDLLILISGPEPQRSIFEETLWQQLEKIPGHIVVLRGLPSVKDTRTIANKNITVFNHLPAKELNELLQRSKYVMARCGYSTIMDLAALNQKAILVPTPGQTEQEYLAGYLKEKKFFYSTEQEGFCLETEMANVKKFPFAPIDILQGMNEQIVIDWVNRIRR